MADDSGGALPNRDLGEEGFGIYLPILPYLPLAAETIVGDWRLLPFHLPRPDPIDEVAVEVELAINAYNAAGAGYHFGALCSLADPDCDPQLREELFWPLAQAVLGAMLYANPRLDEHDTWCDCKKHGTTTSENAHLVVVPLGAEFINSRVGSRIVRTATILRRPGEEYTIPPPEALYLPDSATDLDGGLASRIYAALRRGDDLGRRLDNALAWLDFIAANGTSVVASVRIMALRSAFEALFGETRTSHLRALVGELLSPNSPKTDRSRYEHGRARSAHLSDTEWWFQRFALLRNALTHGAPVDDSAWIHDRLPHTHIAQEALVVAIGTLASP